MKVGIWFAVFLCLPFLVLNAATNSVVLAPANIDQAPIQKLSSSSSETSLEFRMAGIEVEDVEADGVTAKKVTPLTSETEKFGEIAETGLPDLPILSQLVAIPDQAGVTVEILSASFELLENYDIMPTQPPALDGSNEVIPYTKNEEFYQKNEFYPSEIVQLGEPVIMRDLRMIQTIVNPIQYNPVTRQLKVYTDIQYRLSYSGTDMRNAKVRRFNYISEGFLPLYRSLVPNADEILAGMEPARGGYVIIAKASLVDSLKALAFWKHQKGYITRIVPTTEIAPGGTPTYLQVYNFLRTAYETWDVPPEYVMLVGDRDGSFPLTDYPYSGYASDHQYACLEGSDFLPDIFVARLSIDNILQFRIAVSKIFKYEKTPYMQDPQHWIRGLSVGYTWYNTARLTTLWVRELALQEGFTRVDTVYGSSSNPDVVTYMNSGPGMIWYRGAGDQTGWWGPSYTISNLNAMPSNQKLGIMTPLTCGLGDFGPYDCFGETWIRMGINPDSLKGGPAFFGVSDHFTHTKWNNPIMVGYFDGLFELGVSHFAAAAVAGKLQMYRTFPGNPSGYVQQYFNTYNMLGDPELEVRTKIPEGILVEHLPTIPYGTGFFQARVTDTLGVPIEGAIATIIKGRDTNEEIFKVDKSDANGYLEFTFETSHPDTIFFTVSGQNLIPYQADILMYQSDISVGFDSFYVDGGDNIISPNETIQLGVVLRNFGTGQATGVRAELDPQDTELVETSDGVHYYGDIQPGQHGFSDPFSIHIKPNAVNGEVARIRVEASDWVNNMWESGLDLTITAPRLIVNTVTFPGGNNRLDPGDTCNMTITLSNQGGLPAQGVNATLSTEDPYVSIINSSADFGDIPIGGNASNIVPMIIHVSDEAYDGRSINMLLHTVTSDGMEADIPFSVAAGVVTYTDPTGPDRYGYYAYDNTDVDNSLHPTYNWEELSPGLGGPGTRINFSSTDDKSVLVTLPFAFTYYGKRYLTVIVCTNGFISPDTYRMDMGGNYWANFFNWPIPDPGNAKAQISPFWDDLQISLTGNYGVFSWHDVTNHRFLIEWNHTTHRNTGAVETFEIIIYDPAYYPTITGDAEIVFQYDVINNNDSEENYSSVGIESWDEQDGIEYTFDNIYGPGAASLTAGRAIKFTTNNNRGGITGIADLTDSNLDSGVKVTASNGRYAMTSELGDYLIRDLPPGTYSATAEKKGYFGSSINSILVVANRSAQGVNFSLNPCPVPTDLTASEGLTGQIDVNWTAVNHQDLIGYDLYRSPWENGEYVKLNTTPLVGTSYSDNSITDSSYYWYYAVALYAGADWTAESKPSNKDSGMLGVPPGAITGRVTEADGSTPIEGALVRSLNGAVEMRRDTTDSGGRYLLANLPAISVDIEASKEGYNPGTIYGIEVVSSETTQVNLILAPEGTSCVYVVGDANGNGSFNGLDVTYSVAYFKGGTPPPYTCECTPGNTWFVAGDVNNSCSFNGLDVTYMVAYFKGGPVPHPCADCPPGRLLVPPDPGVGPIPAVQPATSPISKTDLKAGNAQ